MAEQWDLDEEGVRRLGALTLEQPGRARLGGLVPGVWGLRLRGRKLRWKLGNLKWTRGKGGEGTVPEAEERLLRQKSYTKVEVKEVNNLGLGRRARN